VANASKGDFAHDALATLPEAVPDASEARSVSASDSLLAEVGPG